MTRSIPVRSHAPAAPLPPAPPLQSEIARAMPFDQLRYASVWEDVGLLRAALAVGPADDVLSVTSGGDNVLGLLLDAPRSLTAVDINPCQSALLHLKLAALQALGHAEFVALLGVRPCADRWALYRTCRPLLPPDARRFWDEQRAAIDAGIDGQGRLERYFAGWRETLLFPALPPDAVAALFELDSLEAQAEAFHRFATPAFEARFRWYFGQAMMARHGRDPAQFAHVEQDAGLHFWRRFTYACTQLPLKGNAYLERFMTGGVADLSRAHPYLRPDGFDRLRLLSDRVEVVTAELEQVVSGAPGRFSAVNLSDVFEYASAAHTEQVLRALHGAMRPGGRLAYWSLLVDRARPASLDAHYRSHDARAHALWTQDRSWFYRRFHLEEARPSPAPSCAPRLQREDFDRRCLG